MNGKQDEMARNIIASVIVGQRVTAVFPNEEQEKAMLAYVEGALTPEERKRLSTLHSRMIPPDWNYILRPGLLP